MTSILVSGTLPSGIDNLANLNGNKCSVAVLFRRLRENGRPDNNDKIVVELTNGESLSRDVGDRRHVKVVKPGNKLGSAGTSINIGKVDVFDGHSKGRPRRFPAALGAGLVLDDSVGDQSVELVFALEHYGAASGEANLRIKWNVEESE